MQPLNGEKTHALSEHSLGRLREIARHPLPRQDVNPGVANRLLREGLVQEVLLPSPFKSHKGKSIAHLSITAEGRQRLGCSD